MANCVISDVNPATAMVSWMAIAVLVPATVIKPARLPPLKAFATINRILGPGITITAVDTAMNAK